MVDGVPTRRDRVRAQTVQEIKQTARSILVDQGAEAVSLRAIAREMGMTAPALYRYFDSHQELLRHVVADILSELSDQLEAVIAASHGVKDKLLAASWEFRRWAFAHPSEFAMVFATPFPDLDSGAPDVTDEQGRRFCAVFLTLYAQLWNERPYPVPEPDEIDPALRGQLEEFGRAIGDPLPVGGLLVFLRSWARLYGTVTLEVFGHLKFALSDTRPMFELMLKDVAAQIGLTTPVHSE